MYRLFVFQCRMLLPRTCQNCILGRAVFKDDFVPSPAARPHSAEGFKAFGIATRLVSIREVQPMFAKLLRRHEGVRLANGTSQQLQTLHPSTRQPGRSRKLLPKGHWRVGRRGACDSVLACFMCHKTRSSGEAKFALLELVGCAAGPTPTTVARASLGETSSPQSPI